MRDNAGTYYPAAQDGQSLALQGQMISATVGVDGSYQIFAGTVLIGQGQLDDTDANPMPLFAAKANAWSAQIDDAMADEASVRAEREAAHFAEADSGPAKRSLEDILTLVDALGGGYEIRRNGCRPTSISHTSMIRILNGLDEFGITVDVKDLPDGSGWYIESTGSSGSSLAQYHFLGY